MDRAAIQQAREDGEYLEAAALAAAAECAWCATWAPTVENPCAYCGRDDA